MRLTLGFIHVWRAGRVHVYLYVQFALVGGGGVGKASEKGGREVVRTTMYL